MFKGKKIIITGAGGFIGAYFLDKLRDNNDVIALLRQDANKYWRLNLFEKNYQTEIADITQREKIISIFSKHKPDITLHFASTGTYPGRQKDREALFSTNITGSMNIIEASLIYSDITLNTGSSSEYGTAPCPMSENGLTFPTILYGATKLFTTHYAKLRAQEEKKKLITIRPFSVYGPYEEPFRLIPYILSSILLNKKIKLSSPHNVRDFIFIEDFYNATVHLLNKIEEFEYGKIFNIGTGKETSISTLVKILQNEIFMKELDIEWSLSQKQPELEHWYADITELEKTGFVHAYDLKSGLIKTYNWLRENIAYYSGD